MEDTTRPEDWDWRGMEVRCRREVARLIGDRAETEDVVQEALLRAWRFHESCKTPAAPGAWVATIARNEALRFLKDRGPHRLAPVEIPAELADARSARVLDAALLRIDVDRALHDATAQERRVLAMRYQDDLATREIARLLRLTEATARVQLHRARLTLRDRLAGCERDL